MLKTLLFDQRRYLNQFFDLIDVGEGQKILEKLIQCKGIFLFSGVGKSGHIAEKVAATFSSTGSRSFFLSPSNALHGDLGFVKSGDLFICFSKSGETEELINIIPHIKRKGVETIAIISRKGSKMAEICDFSLLLPVEREICPYDLAPTTSTVAQLIFGDCLAIALMQSRLFSVSDFASNHPGGLLGRKITLKVEDLMLKGKDIPLCSPTDRLIDVLHELSGKRCGCLVVADETGKLEGIFTDGDLRRAIQSRGPEALNLTLDQLMTRSPKNVSRGKLIVEAVQKMEEDSAKPVTVLPVLEEGRLVGLLRMHDILQKEFS